MFCLVTSSVPVGSNTAPGHGRCERDGVGRGSFGGILMNATENEKSRQTKAMKDDTNESYPAMWVYVMNAQHRGNV